MAHAYETFAEGGRRVYSRELGAPNKGPVGIAQIYCPTVCPHKNLIDHPDYERVLPASVAQTVHEMLTGVVQHGTGTAAAITGVDVAGKTGTTTNYADAWFVGWTPQLTTAVWVGYPEQARADDHATTTARRSRAARTPRSSGTTSWSRRCRSWPPRTRPRARPAPPRAADRHDRVGVGLAERVRREHQLVGDHADSGRRRHDRCGQHRRRDAERWRRNRRWRQRWRNDRRRWRDGRRRKRGWRHDRRRWRNRGRWHDRRRRWRLRGRLRLWLGWRRHRRRLTGGSGRACSGGRGDGRRAQRGPESALYPRERGPRQEAAPHRGEAPLELGGLGDPDPAARGDGRVPPGGWLARDHDRTAGQIVAVLHELDP